MAREWIVVLTLSGFLVIPLIDIVIVNGAQQITYAPMINAKVFADLTWNLLIEFLPPLSPNSELIEAWTKVY